jgi:hypothetical protein
MRFGFFVLPAVLMLAACGGSSDDGFNNERNSSTASTEEPAELDETDLARELLLRVSDFPAGWSEEAADDEESPLDECDLEDAPGKTGEAETGEFSDGSDFAITENVAVFESAQDVSMALGGIEELAQCFVQMINEGEADDDEIEASDASFSSLSFPAKGDESYAYRLKFHVKAKEQSGLGSEGDVFFDIVYARVGRVGIGIYAFETFTAPEPAEWEPFVDIAVERARTGVD